MNLYHCHIDLRNDAKALAFGVAVENWMEHLKSNGSIQSWSLHRRKLGFGAPRARDFFLEIELRDLAQLDQAFRYSGKGGETVERLHAAVHQMISEFEVALYRPFPDQEKVERMSLI